MLKKIDLNVDIKANGTVFCDPSRIEQVLSNLIKNSIDFVPDIDGKITVRVQKDDNDINSDFKMALFAVEDNGIGINPEKADKLFQKFYQIDTGPTRKHAGTGLGQLAVHDNLQQDFINIAAHELRTPIQPILGLSQFLRTKSKESLFIDALDIVIRNAIRLQSLTEDILDVQKIESNTLQLNKESLDLHALISDLVGDYKKQLLNEKREYISLATELSFSKPIFLKADRHRLVRVVDNLLNNAVKFTKEGAIVTTVKEEEDQQPKLVVSVKDSGDGIDPDILPKLFSNTPVILRVIWAGR